MKKIQSILAVACVLGLMTPASAQLAVPAQNSTTTSVTKTVVVCEKITEKVNARITKFSDVSSAHAVKVDKTIDTLRSVSEKLKARSIDTTALDAQIATLVEKKIKLDTDKQALVLKLQESRQYTCGASQGQFKTKISEAKKLQDVVVADVKDIHSFVKNIRDSIKTIRTQIASSTPLV